MSGTEEAAAFERLYQLHFARIRSLCGQILRSSSAAEDMAQETLLRAWQRRADIRDEDVGAWLTVVARNLCISSMRREWRSTPVDQLPETPDDQLDPAAVILSLDARRSVRSAFKRLGTRHRRVLYMREVGEADYDAIGSELGLTAEGARSMAFRARRVLRDHLVAVGEGIGAWIFAVRTRFLLRTRDAIRGAEPATASALQAAGTLLLAAGFAIGSGGVTTSNTKARSGGFVGPAVVVAVGDRSGTTDNAGNRRTISAPAAAAAEGRIAVTDGPGALRAGYDPSTRGGGVVVDAPKPGGGTSKQGVLITHYEDGNPCWTCDEEDLVWETVCSMEARICEVVSGGAQ